MNNIDGAKLKNHAHTYVYVRRCCNACRGVPGAVRPHARDQRGGRQLQGPAAPVAGAVLRGTQDLRVPLQRPHQRQRPQRVRQRHVLPDHRPRQAAAGPLLADVRRRPAGPLVLINCVRECVPDPPAGIYRWVIITPKIRR